MTRNGENGPDPLSRVLAAVDRAAARARRCRLRRLALTYERERHLSSWIALPRHVRTLPEPARTGAIIAGLKRALRMSIRQRARRDWGWSPRRHTALLTALGGELRRLRGLE